jgi:maltooligosyltrehalose trehalohydrolase
VIARKLSVGAEIMRTGGVHFRVWAPRHARVDVVLEGGPGAPAAEELSHEGDGWFSGLVESASVDTLYRFRLSSGNAFPDPASRYQPDGPHGPSRVVDPSSFRWTDQSWRGIDRRQPQVIYELHVGTFTTEGTFRSAARELPYLADLGVTIIEVMPIAEFPGSFGWGYDGVDLFAPSRLYGSPDDVRAFVDRAHAQGVGVILDVVYNHFGPDGNYLKEFAADYFTDRYQCDWGEAVNFDGRNARAVRQFVLDNAAYWISEFHFDGLRLDATQQIFDSSTPHILAEITRRACRVGHPRLVYIAAENEPQDVRLIAPPNAGGYGIDALWNDDFHHSAMVALTGRREAYYSDYMGTPQEFVSAAKYGFLYQGQYYRWQKNRRGTPGSSGTRGKFINFIQNHDQVANSARGERVHALTAAAKLRALTALFVLMPGTPMLFQGQEFGASAPFLYFADHKPELAARVKRGRLEFLTQFPSLASPAIQSALADPSNPQTFLTSKLDLTERAQKQRIIELHRDLFRLRRDDPALSAAADAHIDGAVLGDHAFVLRFFGADSALDRLLIVNLGATLRPDAVPEPLLAPPAHMHWRTLWSSEDPRYGGNSVPELEQDDGWHIPAEAAVVLEPIDRD